MPRGPSKLNFQETLEEGPVTLKRLLKMAADIADGMHYLSSMGVIHMDLAARNCLVQRKDRTEDGVYEQIKICDYGLMTQLEVSFQICLESHVSI